MADVSPPAVQECTACGALIDVTDEQPLALMHCPTCGAAIRVRRIFDHFELLEILGAGGMGAVYRAMDGHLKRAVALKILRPEHSSNAELIKSFASEAAITASINHPHVVKVYSTGTDHGVFYIAMELVDKGSLDDLMGLQGPIAEKQVLDVGIQIAQGLNAAYQRGLIHRDIKPGNILFADAHTAKIVDFGLAVLQEQAGHVDGEVWGTPYYVAPEKLEHPPREDCRSDMYSLAATLFHAAAGRPMFEADTASMVTLKHLKSQPVSLQAFAPHISSATAYVINKTLSKDPEKRYETYEELIESLEYARTSLQEAQMETIAQQRAELGASRGVSWVTLAVIACIVGVGVFFLAHRNPPATAGGVPATVVAPAETPETAFHKARLALAEGKAPEAAAALLALDEQARTGQPLRNWITMHAALAFFLAGQPAEARGELQKIEQRGVYTTAAQELKLANFFVDLAGLAAQESAPTSSVTEKFDAATYESFALLLLAAKAWQAGNFAEAGVLFHAFAAATPSGAEPWVEEDKATAAPYAADLAKYQTATQTAKQASGLAGKRKALREVRDLRKNLTLPGKLGDAMDGIAVNLEKEIQGLEEEKVRLDAEIAAADEKLMIPVLARLNSSCAYFKFQDALQAISTASVRGDKARADRTAWVQKMEWLVRFKKTLINDLNTVGYARPLQRRNGTVIPDGLRSASESQAEMVTPFGNVPVPWTDLSVETIAQMADTFLRNAPDLADRQWLLGVYLALMGKKSDGLALLKQAAATKPDYASYLPLFESAAAGAAP